MIIVIGVDIIQERPKFESWLGRTFPLSHLISSYEVRSSLSTNRSVKP